MYADGFQGPEQRWATARAFKNLAGSYKPFDWLTLWPKVKTLCWMAAPDHLQFLEHFLTPNLHNLEIRLEGAGNIEVGVALFDVGERCKNLEDLRLFGSEMRDDEDIQNAIREIIYYNSRTLRIFYPPQGPSEDLVYDILQLPALEVLEIHIPEIYSSVPNRHSLKYLTFTLDDVPDLMHVLGALRQSRIAEFSLICPYPTVEDDHAAMADLFKDTGLYSSVECFSWEPPTYGGAPTWQFVTTLNSFVNVEELSLGASCAPTCCFRFRHEHVVELSKWMPRLRALNLGGSPCAGGGVTDIGYRTLAALAKNCPKLSTLSIHFNAGTPDLPDPVEPNWNLAVWNVGGTAISKRQKFLTTTALVVSKLFPKVTFVGMKHQYANEWNVIQEGLRMFTLPAGRGHPNLM